MEWANYMDSGRVKDDGPQRFDGIDIKTLNVHYYRDKWISRAHARSAAGSQRGYNQRGFHVPPAYTRECQSSRGISGSQLKHVGMITDPVGENGLAESSVRRALGTLYWAEGITCNAFETGSREMMHLDGKSCNFQFPTIEDKQKARDLIQINSTQRDKQRELPQK